MSLREDWCDHDAGLHLTERDRRLAREWGLLPATPSGIPTLSSRTALGTVLPSEPILMFDRELPSPYHALKWKLEQRNWHPDTICDFLDRLGFKP